MAPWPSPPTPPPGEGPVRPVSVSVHEGSIAALKARTSKRGMSAHVETLIQRQLERDRLRELIEDAEAEHGPVDQARSRPNESSCAVRRQARRTPRERHPRPRLPGPVQTRTTHPRTHRWPAAAEAERIRPITGSVPLVEAHAPRTHQARFDHAVSRVRIIPPTEAIAHHASRLLAAAGLRLGSTGLDPGRKSPGRKRGIATNVPGLNQHVARCGTTVTGRVAATPPDSRQHHLVGGGKPGCSKRAHSKKASYGDPLKWSRSSSWFSTASLSGRVSCRCRT